MHTPKKKNPKQMQPDLFKTFLLCSQQLNNLQGKNMLEPIDEESDAHVSGNQNLMLVNGL